MNFIEELRWRGILQDITPNLEKYLKETVNPSAYIGFDPTAPALTIGNYVPTMILKLFQLSGGKPIVLMGGATGRIGDPSGKDQERQLKTTNELDKNLEHQQMLFRKLLDFDSGATTSAEFFNNFEIYRDMSIFDFLRDVGKTVTVNYMLSKDSVQNRLESGISFTEFSYQLIQGYDFVWLYKNKNCRIQMGGSDQWGNIMSGSHMIGKILGHEAEGHAATVKLLTKKDGTKFGKSEKGNIWLDPTMTSPYQFYQFWFNADDEDILRYNRYFSLKTHEAIEALEAEHLAKLGERVLQKALAEEMTLRIHGDLGLKTAMDATSFFFNKKMTAETLATFNTETFDSIATEVNTVTLSRAVLLGEGSGLGAVLTENCKFFESNADIRRAIQGNALSINKNKVTDFGLLINQDFILPAGYVLVENGKKSQFLIKIMD